MADMDLRSALAKPATMLAEKLKPAPQPHDARAVANFLLGDDGAGGCARKFTPLQIIKLVYICHGCMLGLHGRRLIRQEVEAWPYGPVISAVYNGVRHYRGEAITAPISFDDGQERPFDELEMDLMNQVIEEYGGLEGTELSTLTHTVGSPWHQVWDEAKDPVIPTGMIKEYFASLVPGHN